MLIELAGIAGAGAAALYLFRRHASTRSDNGPTEQRRMASYPLEGNDAGYKIESGEVLLKRFEPMLRILQDGLGFSDEEWKRIAFPVLVRFAEHVQKLPASEKDHHRLAYGLLAHSLEVSRYALKLYQLSNFMSDAPREMKTELVDRWAFAAFLGGLLHDAGKPVSDVAVFNRETGESWKPITETLFEWGERTGTDRYWFRFRKERNYEDHELMNALILERVLTPEAKRYLTDLDTTVFEALVFCLNRAKQKSTRPRFNKLMSLIVEADKTSVEKDKKRYLAPEDKENYQPSLAEVAADAFITLIKRSETKRWSVNKPGAAFFASPKGVFVSWDAQKNTDFKRFIEDVIGSEELARLPNEVLFELLQDAGIFYKKKDFDSWKCTVSVKAPGSTPWKTVLNLTPLNHPEAVRAVLEKIEKTEAVKEAGMKLNDPQNLLSDISSDVRALVDDFYAIDEQPDEPSEETASVSQEQGCETAEEADGDAEKKAQDSQPAQTQESADAGESGETKNKRRKGAGKDKRKTEKKKEDKEPPIDNSEPSKRNETSAIEQPEEGASKNDGSEQPSRPASKMPVPPVSKVASLPKGMAPPGRAEKVARQKGKSNTGKQSAKLSINLEDNPHYQSLVEDGQAGNILSSIGVLMAMGVLDESVVCYENDRIFLVWPGALEKQGFSPEHLKDELVEEGAIELAPDQSYIHKEYLRCKSATVESLKLTEEMTLKFVKAFMEGNASLTDETDNQKKKSNASKGRNIGSIDNHRVSPPPSTTKKKEVQSDKSGESEAPESPSTVSATDTSSEKPSDEKKQARKNKPAKRRKKEAENTTPPVTQPPQGQDKQAAETSAVKATASNSSSQEQNASPVDTEKKEAPNSKSKQQDQGGSPRAKARKTETPAPTQTMLPEKQARKVCIPWDNALEAGMNFLLRPKKPLIKAEGEEVFLHGAHLEKIASLISSFTNVELNVALFERVPHRHDSHWFVVGRDYLPRTYKKLMEELADE